MPPPQPFVLATGDVLCLDCDGQTVLVPRIVRRGKHMGRVYVKCHKPHAHTNNQHYIYPPGSISLEVIQKASTNFSDSPLPSPLPSPPPSVPASPVSGPARLPKSFTPFPMSLDPTSSSTAGPSASQASSTSRKKRCRAAVKDNKATPALKCALPDCTGRAPSSAYECVRRMCITHCGFLGGCTSAPTHVDLRPKQGHSQPGPSTSQADPSGTQALALALDEALLKIDPALRALAPSATSKGKQRTVEPAALSLPSSGRVSTTDALPFESTRYTVQMDSTWNGKYEIDQGRMVRNISGEHLRKARQKDVKKVLKVFIYHEDNIDPKLLYLQGQTNLPSWPYFSLLACAQSRPLELPYLREDTLVDKWDAGEFQLWASCDIGLIHTVRENDTLLFKLREVKQCFGLDVLTCRMGKMKTPVNAMRKTDISLMRKRPRPSSPDLLASPHSSDESPSDCTVPSPPARSIRCKVSPASPASSSSSSALMSPSPSCPDPSPSRPGPSLLQPERHLLNRIAGLPLPRLPPSLTAVPSPPSPLGPSPMLPPKAFIQEPNVIQWPRDWHAADIVNGLIWLRSPSLRDKGLSEGFKYVFGVRYVRSTVYETVDKWGRLEAPHRRSLYDAAHTPLGYWRSIKKDGGEKKKRGKKKAEIPEETDLDVSNVPVTPRIKVESASPEIQVVEGF
ncbi:hypothetical protein CONPUDRAFT_148328 [Coniophora puteana RWD-64-598 SS2]|uniref:Uncharacterized protein n=1 Tax=Coniophora puteana (strain RWD-64-598) TaxID=741705 RepID=A0A5M3N5U6_CONPW|nr:uncharacterized protein CONPUDRAFT_148328 [Coniophora puteana RWD-64-598 SS2]EIW86235.1 hypothetical protein CONPUDRAFT_148328 [Coniophora puteana RWD-64-598 SS2]